MKFRALSTALLTAILIAVCADTAGAAVLVHDFELSAKVQGLETYYADAVGSKDQMQCDGVKGSCPQPLSWANGTALRFDGTNDNLTVSNVNIQKAPFAVGGWFCPVTTNGGQTFIGKHAASGANEFLLGIWDGYLQLTWGGQAWNVVAARAKCQHVVVNHTGVALEVFLDGRFLARKNMPSATIVPGGKPWVVGVDWDSATNANDYFKGVADQVFIVPNTLSSAAITGLYETTKVVALDKFVGPVSPDTMVSVCPTGAVCPVVSAHSATQHTFNGKNDYRVLPTLPVGSAFTWSFMAAFNNKDDQSVIGKHAATGENQFLFGIWGGYLKAYFGETEIKLAEVPMGWHRYRVQVDRLGPKQSFMKVFIDDWEAFSGPIAHKNIALNTLDRPWVVAQEWDGANTSDFMNGSIAALTLHRSAAPVRPIAFNTYGMTNNFASKTFSYQVGGVLRNAECAKSVCPALVEHMSGQGAKFSGAQWLKLPGLDVGEHSFAMGGWICPETKGDQAYFARNSVSGGNQFLLGVWNGELQAWLGSTKMKIQTAQAGCQHVIVNVLPNHMEALINGGETVVFQPHATSLPLQGRDWTIGQEWDGNTASDFFRGVMDDVFIMPGTVSRGLAQQLYETTTTIELQPTGPVPMNGLVAQGKWPARSTTSVAGELAYKFDGTNHLTLPHVDVGKYFKISMWVNPSNTNNQAYLGKHTNSGANQLLIGQWNKGMQITLGETGIALGAVETGWHKIEIYFARVLPGETKVQAYIDSKQQVDQLVKHAPIDLRQGRDWVVGQEWDGNNTSDHFVGEISGLRIYRLTKQSMNSNTVDRTQQYVAESPVMSSVPNGKYANAVHYWALREKLYPPLLDTIIEKTKIIAEYETTHLAEVAVLQTEVVTAGLSACMPEIKGKIPTQDSAQWLSEKCAPKNTTGAKVEMGTAMVQSAERDRMRAYASLRKEYEDLLQAVSVLQWSNYDVDTMKVLSKATAYHYVALMHMLNTRDLSYEECASPLTNKYMLWDMLNNADDSSLITKYPSVWSDLLQCQNIINVRYLEHMMQQAYVGTLAVVDTHLGTHTYASYVKLRLLRDLSPFMLLLFDSHKDDFTLPSRTMLQEYAAEIRNVYNGGSSYPIALLNPSGIYFRNSDQPGIAQVSLCTPDVQLPLMYQVLPEDKSVLSNIPIYDKWLTDQWRTTVCANNPSEYRVMLEVDGSGRCVHLPNLLDVATHAVPMGDGHCSIRDTVLKNKGCCPDHLQ